MRKDDTANLGAANRTFLVLLALTFVTFFAGESHVEGVLLSGMVLGVALLKGHLLGEHFMGLARVRGVWRWIVVIWLFFPAMLIGTTFVLAAR
ncbi:MAG TPA: cytochrome C oxidase subunit IV family protein [Gammaproteobacteria bacterium]